MQSIFLRRSVRFLVATGLSVALGATPLLAQHVSTDYDRKTDFGQFHTFSVYKVQASSPLVEGRLRDILAADLTARGLQQVPEGGQLTVTAVGTRGSQQAYNTFYEGLGGGGFGWRGRGFGGFGGGFGGGGFGNDGISNTSVINIPVGSLVIDAYNSDHQLVFRGMANDSLSDKEEKNTKKLSKAIKKIVKELPTQAAR